MGSGDSGCRGSPKPNEVRHEALCRSLLLVQAWYTAVIQAFSFRFDSFLLSLGPWTSHFSPSLSFPIYGMGVGIPALANSQIGKQE